jgi:hypothetical protein
MQRRVTGTIIGSIIGSILGSILALAAVAGCGAGATTSAGRTGSAPAASAGSASPPASSVPGSPAGSAPVASATSGPGQSGSPGPGPVPGVTGPAATAATGSPPPQAAHAQAQVAGTAVACPPGPIAFPQEGAGAAGAAGGAATASALPPAAQIAAVVRCQTVSRSYPGLGTWDVELAEVADSGLAPLLSALAQPSQPRPPDMLCPDIAMIVPSFVLVETDGHVIAPRIPTTPCGQPAPAVLTALNGLDFRVVDAARIGPIGGRS